ncbi:MAG: type II toxin-antitoxin system Phd/YefM family antitoxin [Streptosporangiaceae bacterium]
MTSEIPVTQAREELAELINRVAYGHERIILTRHSKPVACLVPPEDLARLQEGEQEGPSVSYTAGTAPAAPAHQPATPGLMPVAAQYRAPGQPRG